jgi:hypothetical protein
MTFICSFCESNKENGSWFIHTGYCDTCRKVRDLAKIYTMDIMLKTLETIYVRDQNPIQKRTEAIVDGVELRSSKKGKIAII